MSFQVFGIPVSRGVAIGRAVLVASSRIDVAHYFVTPNEIQGEVGRLLRARDAVALELTTLKDELPEDAPHELAALLDVHLMVQPVDSLAQAFCRAGADIVRTPRYRRWRRSYTTRVSRRRARATRVR